MIYRQKYDCLFFHKTSSWRQRSLYYLSNDIGLPETCKIDRNLWRFLIGYSSTFSVHVLFCFIYLVPTLPRFLIVIYNYLKFTSCNFYILWHTLFCPFSLGMYLELFYFYPSLSVGLLNKQEQQVDLFLTWWHYCPEEYITCERSLKVVCCGCGHCFRRFAILVSGVHTRWDVLTPRGLASPSTEST